MQLGFIIPDINNKDRTQEQFNEVIRCAEDLGLQLEWQGMAMTWLAENTRLLVAREEGKCVGMAVMTYGRRWFDENQTASIILIEGAPRAAMIDYLRQACKILGVHSIYLQKEEGDNFQGAEVTMLKMDV